MQRNDSLLKKTTYIILLIILSIAPFFRGLFFQEELFPTHIISFVLALIWVGSRFNDREYKLIKTPTDVFAIGVVVIYALSILYGVNTGLAIEEALKYLNYFVIFILARDLADTDNKRKWLINIILLSGIGVSIVGIGAAIGSISYNGAYVGNRINSTFQYPNTLASYLAALFILAMGYLLAEKDKRIKPLYAIAANIYLFTFILTYSRGMWLLFPIVVVLFIAIVPNNRKLETFIYMLINTALAVPLSFTFAQRLEGSASTTWMIFIASFIIAGIITYGLAHIEDKFRDISIKKIITVLVAILVVSTGILVYAIKAVEPLHMANNTGEDKWTSLSRNIGKVEQNQEYTLNVEYNADAEEEKPYAGRVRIYSVDEQGDLERLQFTNITEFDNTNIDIPFATNDSTEGVRVYFDNYYTGTSITYNSAKIFDKENNLVANVSLSYKYIPENIVSRIDSITLKESSAKGRLAFYDDAFKIIKDNAIFGTGGGGWHTLYQMYQSYGYYTSQAHNYYLQMWIEVGIIGLILFAALILTMAYFTLKKYRDNDTDSDKIVQGSILIAIVSILIHAFMDFDLSLSAFTFILWALMGILAQNSAQINFKKTKIPRVFFAKLLVLGIFGTTLFTIGNNYGDKAVLASGQNNIDAAIANFEKASKFHPFKPEFKIDLANHYMVKYKNEKDDQYLDKSKEMMKKGLELGKYNPQYHAMAASYSLGTGDIEEGLRLIDESIRLQPMEPRNYAQKCDAYLAVFNYYINQDVEKAKEIISKAYEVKEQINKANETAMRPLDYNEDLLYKIGYIQFNYENLTDQEYKLPKGYSLDFAYYFDVDMNGDGKLDMLRTSNSKEGNTQYEVKDGYVRITNDGKKYGFVYPYGIKLESNTEYKAIFKARGNTKKNTFNFYIYDNRAENKAQAVLKNIDLTDNWQYYEVDFQTDSDIEPGTQYLRFQHNGNDDGYIDLGEVVIFKK